jgi:pathogenesis-related protein 1
MRAARILATLGVALLTSVALFGVIEAAAGRPGADGSGLTRDQADEMVRAHNAWRWRVGVPSLRWAGDLAARAQARAAHLAAHGCIIEHGRLPGNVGENLYRAGPLRADGREDELFLVTPTHVVDLWGAESADYSSEHDSCAWDRQCGHYTQIVWPTTEEVGCGRSVCPSLGQVWVCNYRPKGNIRILRRGPPAFARTMPRRQ